MSEIRWGRKGQRLIWTVRRSPLKLAWLPCRGRAASRKQGPFRVAPVGPWPSHPLSGPWWSLCKVGILILLPEGSCDFLIEAKSAKLRYLPFPLAAVTLICGESNNLGVGNCFRFWIQPTNWHLNTLQSSLFQTSTIIRITRHSFNAHSLAPFLTHWTNTSREASEKLCG